MVILRSERSYPVFPVSSWDVFHVLSPAALVSESGDLLDHVAQRFQLAQPFSVELHLEDFLELHHYLDEIERVHAKDRQRRALQHLVHVGGHRIADDLWIQSKVV